MKKTLFSSWSSCSLSLMVFTSFITSIGNIISAMEREVYWIFIQYAVLCPVSFTGGEKHSCGVHLKGTGDERMR